VDVSEIARHVDSVSICCSKGLGAPIGSLLCGSDELIASARRWRKMAGGGLRQAGILAAAIDYALDNNVERLRDDHANAKHLAESLAEIDEVEVLSNQTNMVFIGLPSRESGEQLAASVAEQGIKIIGGQRIRLVTHLDIAESEIDTVARLFREFFQGWRQ